MVPGRTAPPRRAKFGNEQTWVNGIEFDSRWEAQRYGELLRMETLGLIDDLCVHVSYALHVPAPDGRLIRIAGYEADFVYWRDGRLVVEDAKSVVTRRQKDYVLKARHFEVEYAAHIIEVERNRPRSGAEVSP